MVEVSATVDGAASRAFSVALDEFAKTLGNAAASAPRRAAINLCKSFRNNTRVAKKYRPVEAVPIAPVNSFGKYSTKWLSNPSRRLVEIMLPERNVHGIYANLPCGRKNHSGLQKEARRRFGKALMRGLAKRSWGWVMHNIFNGAAPDTPWRMRKNDRRNPKDATSESTSREQRGALLSSGYARICNRLDYITDALRISPDEALRKAANKMIRPIINARLRRGGMSAEEIKSAGHRIQEEWMRQFNS